MSRQSVEHVLRCYGTESDEIFALAVEDASLGRPVAEGSPVIGAQIVHGSRAEMAQHLDDVVLRRTELGTAPALTDKTLEKCAGLMARTLDWSEDRVRQELNRTQNALAGFRLDGRKLGDN